MQDQIQAEQFVSALFAGRVSLEKHRELAAKIRAKHARKKARCVFSKRWGFFVRNRI